jgi:hypothetical protein
METNKKPGNKSRKKEITSEEIVERHMHDSRDVITTEDIQNVKVPPIDESGDVSQTPVSDEAGTNPGHSGEEEKKDSRGENVHEKEIITPWDVIDP